MNVLIPECIGDNVSSRGSDRLGQADTLRRINYGYRVSSSLQGVLEIARREPS